MVLSEETVIFLRERGGGMLCTRDAQNRAFPHECFIAEVGKDLLMGLVPEHLARGLVDNVAANGEAALVASRIPGDHRSVQLKGRITSIEPACARQAEFASVIGPMVDWLKNDVPIEAARAIMDAASRQLVLRIRLDITEVFDQTPGPRAGRPLAGGGA